MAERIATTDTVIYDADWDEVAGHRKHSRTAFVGLDLCETTLDGVEFENCTFRDVRFNCAELLNVAFVNCTFTGCNFFDATFTGCKLVGSRFTNCTLDLMTVDGGDWSFAVLAQADLRRATLTALRMREADLRGVRATSLRECDLSGALFEKADLTGCDLRGSDLSSLDPGQVRLTGAVITVDQAVLLALAQGLDVRAD